MFVSEGPLAESGAEGDDEGPGEVEVFPLLDGTLVEAGGEAERS